MLPVVIRTLILIGSLTTTGLNYSRLDLNSTELEIVFVGLGLGCCCQSLFVQCNTLHGTEYKITCGVCLRVFVCVWHCVCAHTSIRGRISRKRLEIDVRLQWDTNRKWHMADRLDTWPMTSRDLQWSRSWPDISGCKYLENGWR